MIRELNLIQKLETISANFPKNTVVPARATENNKTAENNIHKINYEGVYYRRDIGCNNKKEKNIPISIGIPFLFVFMPY